MKIADFAIPSNLAEARSLLKQLGDRGVPLAGASSLVFMPGDEGKTAVDITRLGLGGIRRGNGLFSIGATTSIADLQKFREAGWVLDRVALRFVTQPLRNVATLGGNIARVFPWADFPVALLALGAEMIVASDAVRQAFADDYFASQPARLFKPGDLLTEIRVPAVASPAGFGYRKETRAASGFSLSTAAVLVELEGRQLKKVRVAIGSCIPMPTRIPALEQALTGEPARPEALRAAIPVTLSELRFKEADGMSSDYIRHLTDVVVGDALEEAVREAKGGNS